MKKTYLITAINPDDNAIISVWAKADDIRQAWEKSLPELQREYHILGYLETILSVTLMNTEPNKH